MFNFLIFRKFFQKGGVNTDDSWKCLYPLMLITATCTFISYFMPFWSFDEACSRGIFFDCCRREFENSTLCHNAKWLTKEREYIYSSCISAYHFSILKTGPY